MVDDKKQNRTAGKKTTPAEKSGAGKRAPEKGTLKKNANRDGRKPSTERLIYRHHRTFVGGGLVGLIILALLVGTEIIPLHGPTATPGGNTDIQVLERQTDPDTPSQSVVSRDGDGSNAHITIHNTPLEQEAEKNDDAEQQQGRRQEHQQARQQDRQQAHKALRQGPGNKIEQQINQLRKVTQGQQQMIKMLNQKQQQQQQTLREQIQNLSLQVANAFEADQPTMLKVNNSLTLLQLRQDVLFFQNQWQQGLLTAEQVRQWQAYTETQGYHKAAGVAAALAQSLEMFGTFNREALRQTAQNVARNNIAGEGKPAPSTAKGKQSPTEPGWWQKLKQRLSAFVTVRRVGEGGVSQDDVSTAAPVLRTRLANMLTQGNMTGFWELMLEENAAEKTDPMLQRLRLLVEAHLTQMNAFQQLYGALTSAQQGDKN